MDLLSHRKTMLRHGRSRFSSGGCASLSAFLTHVMYARWGCPAFMHPHVCWMLTRAWSTSTASEHFLLTQVASAGLLAPDASSTATAPARNQLMDPSDPRLAGRKTLVIYVPKTWVANADDVVDLYVRGLIPTLPRVGVGCSLNNTGSRSAATSRSTNGP